MACTGSFLSCHGHRTQTKPVCVPFFLDFCPLAFVTSPRVADSVVGFAPVELLHLTIDKKKSLFQLNDK